MIVINRLSVIRIILLVLIISTLAFIWSNSLADSEKSSETSGTVVEKIKPVVDPHDKIDDDLFTNIIRKLAHFTEFAVLGAEFILLFSTFDKWKRLSSMYTIPVGTAFLCAVTDELLQLTSAGRSCEFHDMIIDLCGILLGSVLAVGIKRALLNIILKSDKKVRKV